jgi:NAD(P)-dependent dehydrogenase (short-subunit alcohol dehydrogenase family)
MEDKICLVTGANSGIGKYMALGLARAGARVVMVCRSAERGAQAQADVIAGSGSDKVELMLADLSSQADIGNLATAYGQRHQRLDILVNNAGVYLNQRYESVDGLEMTFALNHMGYFSLTNLLLPILSQSGPARIVNISSDAHRMARLDFDDLQNKRAYRGFSVYAQSKLANILFTYELARRLKGRAVTVNAVHPGMVNTNFGANNGGLGGYLFRRIFGLFGLTAVKGAITPLHVALSPAVAGVTGAYFVHQQQTKSSQASYDEDAAARLWTISEGLRQQTESLTDQ